MYVNFLEGRISVKWFSIDMFIYEFNVFHFLASSLLMLSGICKSKESFDGRFDAKDLGFLEFFFLDTWFSVKCSNSCILWLVESSTASVIDKPVENLLYSLNVFSIFFLYSKASSLLEFGMIIAISSPPTLDIKALLGKQFFMIFKPFFRASSPASLPYKSFIALNLLKSP